MLLFCSKHECEKSWKISTSRTLFRTRTWKKNCDFAWFSQKIKINWDLVEMLRKFIDTSIKIRIDDVQSFVTLRVSVNFFYFFNCDFVRFGRNVTKLFTSSICIFIDVSVKFCKILNKFRFILIFRPKRVKSQLELHLSAAKPEAVNCLWSQRQLTVAGYVRGS